jgi:hypothetical protein
MSTFVLIWLLAHGVPADHAEAMTPCIAGYKDPIRLLALMAVENEYQNDPVSGSGACSYFQLLGGRYGHSSCKELKADPALACAEAVRDLGYWESNCGPSMWDAWSKGWSRCWSNPKYKKCHGKTCKQYSSRLERRAMWIQMMWEVWHG